MVGTDSERGETECKGHMTHTLPQETPSLPSPETVMYCLQQYIDVSSCWSQLGFGSTGGLSLPARSGCDRSDVTR
jgi:hypothetical protein